MNVFAENLADLYLMSAILSSAIIYNARYDDGKLTLNAAVPVNGHRFMGSIVISEVLGEIVPVIDKMEFLSSMTFNSKQEIEITTNSQIIRCPVNKISMYFNYNEELMA